MHPFRVVLIIFLFSLAISILFGYPRIYLNDECISANQLHHLLMGIDPLHGYYPYGELAYALSHGNTLSYTLALPVMSLPSYFLFSFFDDSFRLFVNISWFALIVLIVVLIDIWYPRYARYHGVHWTYGALFSASIIFVLNMWLYRPFLWQEYPELAALVFTNHLFFALSMVLIFLIFREILSTDWWGLFGFIVVLCSSSYLFWSDVAKDHILVLFFFLVALYFLILFNKKRSYLNLVSAYIAVGWVAWVRPEVGFGLLLTFIIAGLVVSYHAGLSGEIKTFLCTVASGFGALPLFLNNYGLTGNPFTNPMTMGHQLETNYAIEAMGKSVSSFYSPQFFDPATFFQGLYRIFLDPKTPNAAGILQVSPFAVLAFILITWIIVTGINRKDLFPSFQDKSVILVTIIMTIGITFTYFNCIPWLGDNGGMVPDIRYLSLIYIPLAILGCMLLKWVGFQDYDLKKTIVSFIWVALFSVPFSFIVLQALIGNSVVHQLQVQTWINYVLLTVVTITVIMVIRGKIGKEYLLYLIPVLFVSNLIWFFIVGYRFPNTVWAHYHFWLPTTNWARIVVLQIFPW